MSLLRYQTTPVFHYESGYRDLQDELDRLFDLAWPSESRSSHREFPVDIYQDKHAFHARAEVPGFRKEDLHVEAVDGVLTLSAQQKTESNAEAKNETSTVSERRFSRSFTLPEGVDLDKVQAHYENGILTVTLPKREETKPKPITINVK